MLSDATVERMLWACNERLKNLVTGGCDESVALDRTWDAFDCAYVQSDAHCFDPRDRLFENKLRTIAQKG